ncbi:MAG: ATP-binding protein [Phocaeicola sp.]
MKTKRKIISINEELCNGCGNCIEGCHEGALQLIDNKARIVSELYCDGLGACIGECPTNAITIEEKEAEPYNEIAVIERIAPKGEKTVLAHLKHLKEHGETLYIEQAVAYIKEKNLPINLDLLAEEKPKLACGCPGSMARSFNAAPVATLKPMPTAHAKPAANYTPASALTHWPIQLHLIRPEASFLAGADVIVAADCTAYAFADFHNRFLRDKKLVIACPKLDSNQEIYVAKLTQMINEGAINTLTVVIMEVPCCGGLMHLAKLAAEKAVRKVPIKRIVIGVEGGIKSESWV